MSGPPVPPVPSPAEPRSGKTSAGGGTGGTGSADDTSNGTIQRTAHVLFVVPVLRPAGAERVVAQLADRLREHGFSTSVLCLEDEREAIGVELQSAGVPVEGLRRSRFLSLPCARAIRKRLPAQRPLILNSHLFHANLATRLAYAMLDPQMARDVHVISTVHVVERRFRPWQFLADRLTARYARAQVCVSRLVRDFHQHRTRLPGDFFRVIENGIDVSRFTPAGQAERRAIRPPRVVSIGRLDQQKDYPTLLRAWQRVIAKHPSAELTIAGAGPQQASLQRMVHSLELTNVHFAGFVQDTPGLLRGATLYAQSSAWEGMPLTIAEAMACALPIVATEVGGVGEMIDSGRTGMLVTSGDTESLALEMIRLINDVDSARRLGEAARIEATSRFSVERMVADYAALFGEILRDDE